eukprot:4888878-Prymnesium_polylepis.1
MGSLCTCGSTEPYVRHDRAPLTQRGAASLHHPLPPPPSTAHRARAPYSAPVPPPAGARPTGCCRHHTSPVHARPSQIAALVSLTQLHSFYYLLLQHTPRCSYAALAQMAPSCARTSSSSAHPPTRPSPQSLRQGHSGASLASPSRSDATCSTSA